MGHHISYFILLRRVALQQNLFFKGPTDKNLITICVSAVIIISSAIMGLIVYNINDRNNMAKNIEAAIAKGVDPLSVKCAYETSTNSICITYAVTSKPIMK